MGTAVGVGVTGGAAAFAGWAACAAGSGADYYDCYGLAAAGATVMTGSYAAGQGIIAVNQARNGGTSSSSSGYTDGAKSYPDGQPNRLGETQM